MLDDMEAIKQDLRARGVFPDQVHVRRPHVHANYLPRPTAPSAQLLGEKHPHRFFGPIFSDPQQYPPLQIVDHRHGDLPLAPAHLADPQGMHPRSPSPSRANTGRAPATALHREVPSTKPPAPPPPSPLLDPGGNAACTPRTAAAVLQAGLYE